MLNSVMKFILGDPSKRVIKKYWPLVEQVGALEPEMQGKSDAELAAMTEDFRARYRQGKVEALRDVLQQGRDREWMTKSLTTAAEEFLKQSSGDAEELLKLLPEEHILERQFKKEAGDEADLAEKAWKRYIETKFHTLREFMLPAYAAVREAARRTIGMRGLSSVISV
jgi:preprotein translocase subunit SecA